MQEQNADAATATLVVRRTIRATPEQLFKAWTASEELCWWWGPDNVTCIDAEVDLRVGGQYRLANQMPNGDVVWIVGTFEVIQPPHKLVYTWSIGALGAASPERVTVTFKPHQELTEVVILHERILDAVTRDQHEKGWCGCLNGLAAHLEGVTKGSGLLI